MRQRPLGWVPLSARMCKEMKGKVFATLYPHGETQPKIRVYSYVTRLCALAGAHSFDELRRH